MRVVVALGGNALLRRGQPLDVGIQRANVAAAARALAPVAAEHELVITHGNGPQVGLLALQAEAYPETEPYPLDVLGAQSVGMIGFLIEEELAGLLDGAIATLLTMVEVDPSDPAFADPSKPIGPIYVPEVGERLARERGWTMAPDGAGVRRVVPSPRPRRIVELPTIAILVDAGVTVVCAGGGGIPVVREAGGYHGVRAVVDKDLSAALLAADLDADMLVMLTDVEAVYDGWGTPQAHPIATATPARLRGRSFAAGSMGPKVEAACEFVEVTGRRAAIGHLDAAQQVLDGRAGTHVVEAIEGQREK